MAGAPCATTARRLCVYHASAPRSDEGRLAWGLFLENTHRVKVAGLGQVIGFDLSLPLRRMVTAGVDAELAEDLLGACEIGFLKAQKEEREKDAGEN